MTKRNRKRGQTLVELLISLSVVAIILSMTTALYLEMFQHYSKVSADVDAQSEARMAMGRATQVLRQAMTDPNQPPGPPVLSPTANPLPSATPANSNVVTFREALNMPSDANYQNLTYQCVTIETTPVPGRTNPDLVVQTNDCNGGATTQSTIGRDISNFTVSAVTPSIYDVQITTAPPRGLEQGIQDNISTFTVNSRVFISYYQ